MIKMRELLSIEDPISSKLRIHLSRDPIIKLQRVMQESEPVTKPNGLWYGFGREWIDFQRHEMKVVDGKYVYFVNIVNPDKLLRLSTRKQMYSFLDKYYLKPSINWKRVAEDWGGIEISPWQGKLYYDDARMSWYGGWDIASGCVWEVDIISLKIIYPK